MPCHRERDPLDPWLGAARPAGGPDRPEGRARPDRKVGPHPGSQLSLPGVTSASNALTSSVTFVATLHTPDVFRPRYVSGTQASFRDVQITVIQLAAG